MVVSVAAVSFAAELAQAVAAELAQAVAAVLVLAGSADRRENKPLVEGWEWVTPPHSRPTIVALLQY